MNFLPHCSHSLSRFCFTRPFLPCVAFFTCLLNRAFSKNSFPHTLHLKTYQDTDWYQVQLDYNKADQNNSGSGKSPLLGSGKFWTRAASDLLERLGHAVRLDVRVPVLLPAVALSTHLALERLQAHVLVHVLLEVFSFIEPLITAVGIMGKNMKASCQQPL